LCTAPASVADIDALIDRVYNGLSTMPMVNYPYPSNLVGPAPAYPIRALCLNATSTTPNSTHDYLVALANASNVFLGYDGPCTNLSYMADDDLGKDILWCNELIVPFGQTGVTDMFHPRAWNETEHTAKCIAKYGLTPQYDWMADHFGGRNPSRDFNPFTNIVQSNGNIDAWTVGSYLKNVSDSFITINID
jgi:hypothetical protein